MDSRIIRNSRSRFQNFPKAFPVSNIRVPEKMKMAADLSKEMKEIINDAGSPFKSTNGGFKLKKLRKVHENLQPSLTLKALQ